MAAQEPNHDRCDQLLNRRLGIQPQHRRGWSASQVSCVTRPLRSEPGRVVDSAQAMDSALILAMSPPRRIPRTQRAASAGEAAACAGRAGVSRNTTSV